MPMVFLLISLLFAMPVASPHPADAPDGLAAPKTCYAYVSSDGRDADPDLTQYYTRVFRFSIDQNDRCRSHQTRIENQYSDAFRARFGEAPYSATAWPYHESFGAAERARIKAMAKLDKSWTVRTFHDFTYYPED
jgi:hypothetical protein